MRHRSRWFFLSLAAVVALVCGLTGVGWAAEELSAVIKTTEKKTITVTAISGDGRIEFTPQGGKKTKVLFKDIARIDWDAGPREHTITTHDGKTQKVQRAWIFCGSGAYLQFTGTDQDGADAGGSISGSDIASIVFAKAGAPAKPAGPTAAVVADPVSEKPTEPAKPATPAEPTSAAQPTAEPVTPAAPAEPAKPAKPARPTKRLSTNNVDYARDAAETLEKNLPQQIAEVVKAKAEGKLAADNSDEGLVWLEIQKRVHRDFANLPRYFFAAKKDGWENSDPELAPLREKMLALAKQSEQAGYWTCTHPDDELGSFNETQFEYWDRLRFKAFGAMLWTVERKEPQQGQGIMEKVTGELAQFEEQWKKDGQKLHPAFLRLKTEIARLQKECEGGFKSAGDAKTSALAAWKALHDEKERLSPFMNKIEGGSIHPNEYAGLIEEIEKFEKADTAVVKEKLEYLGKTYGTTPEAIDQAMGKLAGNDKPEGVVNDLSYLIKRFETIFKAIPPLRKDIGEGLAGQARQELTGMGSYDDSIRAKKYDELKQLVQLGLRYDSHSTDLMDLAGEVAAKATASVADLEKQIAERQWPGHHKGFAGPGSAEELSKAAVDYFNSTCKPSEKALTACVVEPEWYCFKRNIFGQPVQWALTFWVAVDVEGETTPDIINAWSISFLTEENVGVEKAAPFKLAAFNFKQKMKRANVPGLK